MPTTLFPELDTPSLRIDLDRMERNLEEMAALASAHGVRLRPHIKTHKTVQIARKQLELGAIGVTTAKLSEAEVFAAYGLRDLFVCYPLIGEHKLRRLRALHREADLMTLVESVEGARGLSDAMRGESKPLDVLLDIDVGFGRVGVRPERAAEFAAMLSKLPGLRLRGVCTHEGNSYGEPDTHLRAELARGEVGRLVAVARELRGLGHDIEIVSCGSTPGTRGDVTVDGITEMRPGNYVFYDATQVALGVTDYDHCALTVLAQVVSRQSPERAVIDAGAKALTTDRGAHGVGTVAGFGVVRDHPGILIERLSEEHGWLSTGPEEDVAIGERLDVIPNHACVVNNMFNEVAACRGDKVVGRWPITARGCLV